LPTLSCLLSSAVRCVQQGSKAARQGMTGLYLAWPDTGRLEDCGLILRSLRCLWATSSRSALELTLCRWRCI